MTATGESSPERIAAGISWAKNNLITAEDYQARSGNPIQIYADPDLPAIWYHDLNFSYRFKAAGREIGVFLALISAMAIAGGAGDYATLHGAPLFPPTDGDERGVE